MVDQAHAPEHYIERLHTLATVRAFAIYLQESSLLRYGFKYYAGVL